VKRFPFAEKSTKLFECLILLVLFRLEPLVTNSDILRRLRYSLDLSDSAMIATFAAGGHEATREQVSDWLKKDDDPAWQRCNDTELATFLNGLIVTRRGKKDGTLPEAEARLNNNLILRKVKIALELKDDDILVIMGLAGLRISKHELSAFFRNKDHKHFRECQDQVLRKFLKGIQLKYRDHLCINN
jgi:uncharacterized protein YehS (DUF1456 family)